MDDSGEVPGARSAREVLATDPIARLLGPHITRPWIFGLVLVVLIATAIVFGPSAESRFIYTDF